MNERVLADIVSGYEMYKASDIWALAAEVRACWKKIEELKQELETVRKDNNGGKQDG